MIHSLEIRQWRDCDICVAYNPVSDEVRNDGLPFCNTFSTPVIIARGGGDACECHITGEELEELLSYGIDSKKRISDKEIWERIQALQADVDTFQDLEPDRIEKVRCAIDELKKVLGEGIIASFTDKKYNQFQLKVFTEEVK